MLTTLVSNSIGDLCEPVLVAIDMISNIKFSKELVLACWSKYDRLWRDIVTTTAGMVQGASLHLVVEQLRVRIE